MVHVLPNEGKKGYGHEKMYHVLSKRTKKKISIMCSTCGGAVCKLHVMANITPRKTAEQAHKNSVSFQSEIPKLPLKSHYKLIGKKQINTVCIFNSISLNGLPGY